MNRHAAYTQSCGTLVRILERAGGLASGQKTKKETRSLIIVQIMNETKPHAPPLVRAPVNSFEFQPCGRTPQAECLMR